jgi:FAD/FMN-containing dehydrogenase/ferredoxin
MTEKPIRKTIPGISPELERPGPDTRAAAGKPASPGTPRTPDTRDLHFFLDGDLPLEQRRAPTRTLALARALAESLALVAEGDGAATLHQRIVTDELLRHEADRDQNVYLGGFFTRTLTRAVPDLIFLPVNPAEAAAALRWARERRVPLTLRGAASTAMGGAVPGDGGLTLDLSRLDSIEIDAAAGACVAGAGARLRTLHEKLAGRGLALKVYPSNLGGTLAGWFATGGIGLNAFGHGRSLDSVLAADVLLPSGEHVRFHADGRLGVPDGRHRRTLPAIASAHWFQDIGVEPITLADLAGSEGVFGIVLQLTVEVVRRPEYGAFLLGFGSAEGALEAAAFIAAQAGSRFPYPANLKFVSGSHLAHARRVWQDEDAKPWRAAPGERSSGAGLPWARIAGPAHLGARIEPDPRGAAYVFVDFPDLAAARRFAAALGSVPGAPVTLGPESVRFAAERFRPQQAKRLGPGLMAAEILMPSAEVPKFLPRAERLARNAGNELDAEVYYLADGTALFIGGYLTDHRSAAFAVDFMIAPALLDLAMQDHGGRPYVLGRWQAAYAAHKFGAHGVDRLRRLKRGLDPDAVVNRGVLLGLRLRGPLGRLLGAGFTSGVGLVRVLYQRAPGLVRPARLLLRPLPGPARGHGAPLPGTHGSAPGASALNPEDRALHCVNCGECNSVCPIFHESKIRLPQMLTHLGEAGRAGRAPSAAGDALLDLCTRCGNCEEVCQAGISHLPLYDSMQQASERERPAPAPRLAPDARRQRHVAILATLRGSSGYLRDFLDVRPGGYGKRQPVALPGMARYLVLRAENDAGPAATCIHCGACVSVCPTHANREFEGTDARSITTEQERCIGCGTCVEVCPANHANGGRTLRVVEAPTLDWFVAIEELEALGKGAPS